MKQSIPSTGDSPDRPYSMVIKSEGTHIHVSGQGPLDLDTYEAFLAGGVSGAAYVDGDGAVSNVVTKLKTDTNTFGAVMPLGNADSVSEADIQTLIDWIDADTRNGGTPRSCRRVIALGASFVWTVENTR